MPDWVAIRAEYEAGTGAGKLCRKHGVNENTLYARVRREGWAKNKHSLRTEIARKCTEKTAEKMADALSDEASLYARTRAAIARAVFARATELENTGAKAAELKAAAETLRILEESWGKSDAGKSSDDVLMQYLEAMKNG